MLTDQEMLAIAERYLESKAQHFGGSDIEVVILTDLTIKKPYGIFLIISRKNMY